jgi:hypothetical protein
MTLSGRDARGPLTMNMNGQAPAVRKKSRAAT